MKKLLLLASLAFTQILSAQLTVDTLAFQDFEVTPSAPVWSFTGPVVYNSGFSAVNAAPSNSPIGIGGSRAWETTSNSGGLILNFDNTAIPAGYDTIRVRFNLAAMNLISSGGGPDNLDYVLVAYSTDGGNTYVNRLRVRGAVNDNSYWPYSATGVAENYYLPATEQTFQPVNTGPQTTLGYSTVEIKFPGTVTQVAMRITGRSSSSTDTWMVDNLVMTGERLCAHSTSAFSVTACGSYVTPSGSTLTASGTYMDTIANVSGCDSVITINATILPTSGATIAPTACASYVSPAGNLYTSSGTYSDTITNAAGCDSVITINLTINNPSASTITTTTCGNYTSPSGNTYSSSGTYYDTIPNAAGCDSVITINLTVNATTTSMFSGDACFSFMLPNGNIVTTTGIYPYDTIMNAAGCDSIIMIDLLIMTVDTSTSVSGATITANAFQGVFQWVDCNNGYAPIAGETGQSFTAPANGSYAALITQGVCSDTSACINITSVGMSEPANASAILSPNPFSDVLLISNCTPGTVITVFSVQGETVYSASCTTSVLAVDLSAQANGVYFVQLKNADGTSNQKVIKY
jgi:hypothetical protein